MANRDNHYEAAFEAYLRQRQVAYVAVDEAKRALLASHSVKSLDFIVSAPGGQRWLVDVKGRKFPSGAQRQYWKNWSTRDDLNSLAEWERLFGEGFSGLLVFAFQIVANRAPLPEEELFAYQERLYGFLGVRRRDYARHARPISPRWDTLAMSPCGFRRLARPMAELLQLPPAVETRPLPPSEPIEVPG
jgi:hypothetical protein